MTWNTFHRRSDVLRSLYSEIDLRQDGHLPFEAPGVAETFHDERDLVAALALRWTMRLQSAIDTRLDQPDLAGDPAAAVTSAWADTALALPGIRAVLDAQSAEPATDAVAEALALAADKEHQVLAFAAGRGRSAQDRSAAVRSSGEALVEQARIELARREPEPATLTEVRRVPRGSAAFVARLKAALAA